jgi:hypothetical protein
MCKKLIFLISFVLVLGIGSNALAAIPEPVGFWRFEGNYTDEMGLANGTRQGTATIVSSDRGPCLNLDGDGWVDIPSGVTELGNLDFSIAAWILVPDEIVVGEPGGCILSKSDGGTGWTMDEKQFYINEEEAGEGGLDGTATYVGWGCDWIRGEQRVDDNTWHHVCVTWDHEGYEGHLYVDGVDDTNVMGYFEGQGDNEGDTVRIGFSPGEHSVNFVGRIDDVAIFDVTLTAEEVFELGGGRYSRSESGVQSQAGKRGGVC